MKKKGYISSLAMFIVVVLMSCSVIDSSPQNSNIVEVTTPVIFSIELEKETYTLEEEIYVKLIFENISYDQEILLKNRFVVCEAISSLEDIIPMITDEHGSKVECQHFGRPPNLSPDFFVLLFPHSGYFKKGLPMKEFFPVLNPGRYELYIIYRNVDDPGDGRTAWKGELISNTVKFRIRP